MLAATGVLRGLQDTRTPLYVAVGGNALNVVLNVVLVHGVGSFAGIGLAGSAIGSVHRPGRVRRWPWWRSWSAAPAARAPRCARTSPASGSRRGPPWPW